MNDLIEHGFRRFPLALFALGPAKVAGELATIAEVPIGGKIFREGMQMQLLRPFALIVYIYAVP